MRSILQKFGSLRARLALTFIVIAGMINAVIGLTGVVVRERQIREAFDTQLTSAATMVITTLDRLGTGWPETDVIQVINDLSDGPVGTVYFVQVRDIGGNRLFRSRSLGDLAMPFDTTLQGHGEETADGDMVTIGTSRGSWVDDILPQGDELRRVIIRHESPAGRQYLVSVATSYKPVNEAVTLLQGVFWAGMLISLFAAGIASWIVVDRALGRLNLVRRLMQELTPGELNRRLLLDEEPTAPDEITAMATEVNEMLARLETSFNAQERFLADASHELRTPIATLLSQAQVLQHQTRSEEEYQEFAQSVAEEMTRLGKIVNSLLSLVRIQDGGKLQHRTEVSVNDVVMDAIEHCAAVFEDRRLRLQVELATGDEPDAEPIVIGNPGLLQIMLENLLRNAAAFSPVDRSIDVRVCVEPGVVRISVRDRGPGIPEHHLTTIFERYQQAPQSSARRCTGLGLSIASTICQLHQGDIAVSCPADGGTQFTITIPHVHREAPETR